MFQNMENIINPVQDVRGSVHHSMIHIENPTRCNNVSFISFIFMWSSTCFGRHTTHHQEPKTALTASGFAYVEGFRLLMMGGVSPETCWASHKYEWYKWYIVASCWIFYVNQSKNWNAWPLKMGLTSCPEWSVRKYHSTLRRTPKRSRYQRFYLQNGELYKRVNWI